MENETAQAYTDEIEETTMDENETIADEQTTKTDKNWGKKRASVSAYYYVVKCCIYIIRGFGFELDGWIPLVDKRTGQHYTPEYIDAIKKNHYTEL